MIRKIEFIEALNIRNNRAEKTRPHLVSFESIKALVTSNIEGCCELKFNDNKRMLVVGEFRVLKDRLEEAQTELLPKLCYVFHQRVAALEYSHYVPVDEVSRVMIHRVTNKVTLILKSGDKLDTDMVMTDLKNTLIEVRF